MKKLLCVICALLTVITTSGLTAAAQPLQDDDVYAVATTAAGNEVVLADAPDAAALSNFESCELIIDEEPVLSVTQSDVPMSTAYYEGNARFSAEFALPDTTRTVFLAGLSADKVEEIQNKLIENYAENADFNLSDLSFIDAEKTGLSGDGDDYLCWAATASNMLIYSGWAAQSGRDYETCDDVFEDFISAFTDSGNNCYYGVGWFFNGINTFAMTFPTASSAVASATEGTGGYLNDYAYDRVCSNITMSVDPIGNMRDLCARLKEGCAVGLGAHIIFQGADAGGHAQTCWGYVVDTAYPDTVTAHYAGLLITDSDSDKRYTERRNSPNVLQAVSLTTGADANGVLTFEYDIDPINHAVLEDYYCLLPYSESTEKETAADATKDKRNTADLAVNEAYLGTDFQASNFMIRMKKIESNTRFYYSPVLSSKADKTYAGSTRIRVTLTDSEGHSETLCDFDTGLTLGYTEYTYFARNLIKENGLPEGDYTVTMTANGNHLIPEAYYYNNTFSFPLKVRDSYLLGDADGDGLIDIMDATTIQRTVAGYTSDEKILQRGRITGDELSIMDATQLQRRLADYMTDYAIGEKRLYD